MLEGQNRSCTAGGKGEVQTSEGLPVTLLTVLSVDHPSGLRQQGVSFKKIFAIVAVAVGDRRLMNLGENFRRKIFSSARVIPAHRRQGNFWRHVLGILEVTVGSAPGIIEQRFYSSSKSKAVTASRTRRSLNTGR